MTLRDSLKVLVGLLLAALPVIVATLLVAPASAQLPQPPPFQTEHLIVLDTPPSYTLAPIPLGGTK